MNSQDFHFISQLLLKRSGLALGEEKVYLLESRLLPVAREYGCRDLPELIHFLRLKPEGKMAQQVVEAMTTNESMFFRDRKPFAQFRTIILPKLIAQAHGRKIRIWSAACSSGQEPYSLAMCLMEEAQSLGVIESEIVASDLSAAMIEKARRGVYSQFEVQRGLPTPMLLKYFTQQEDKSWRINDDLRALLTFRTFNLMENVASLGMFDVIFCRNALIYFDDKAKTAALARISRALNPAGILILGSAETVIGHSDRFEESGETQGMYVLRG